MNEVGLKQVTAVPRSHMELLSNFAATWGRIDGPALGIHCMKCQQDLVGRNGLDDHLLSVSCGCQEFKSDRHGIV